jgi:hypothetical protein
MKEKVVVLRELQRAIIYVRELSKQALEGHVSTAFIVYSVNEGARLTEVYGLLPHAFTPVATSLGPPDLYQLSRHLDLRVLGGLRTVVVEGCVGVAHLQGQTVPEREEQIRAAMRHCAGKSELIVRFEVLRS